ncbi:hypothetical protein VTN00DRAFT_3413 [Thermoascus crustaceus]|uniref:uncharacterized protein n=1 Tax=Thermoascus crustaceus TaxID=5088 RepID=UPI003743D13C
MPASTRSPNEGQLSPLPGVTHFITGHDAAGKAVVRDTRPGNWTPFDNDNMAFDIVYTTSQFPADLNDDKDIAAHDALLASGKMGLVNPSGTVCRFVDFAPGYQCIMHRTQSLDYGIVLEGSIEMVLDSGETRTMHRGDVAVQRATKHAWRNPSKDQWARMIFVLQDCQKVRLVNGTELGEDLSEAKGEIPPSGNDS